MGFKYKSNKKDVEKKLNDAIKQGLEHIGLEFQRNATNKITSNGQVDTGRMRASMTYIVEDIQGKIESDNNGIMHMKDKPKGKLPENTLHLGTNVEYAPFQEKVNPFLKPSIINYKNSYVKIFNKIFNKVVGDRP